MTASTVDKLADPDGIVTTPQALQCRAATVLLVKEAADRLEREYPGWLWAIRPDERGGVIHIFSLRLSGKYGYLLHTKAVQNDPQLQAVVRAGGEILERFGQKRGAYNYQNWQAAKRYLGGVAMDISDKDKRVQRRYRDERFTALVRQGAIELKAVDTPTTSGTRREIFLRPTDKMAMTGQIGTVRGGLIIPGKR